MPKFSERSLNLLNTCHSDLQLLFKHVVKEVDCTVLCGYRGIYDQNMAFITGRSKLQYPGSNHNKIPSKAVDVLPYPINWGDINRMYMFVGYVRCKAEQLGIKIRCGADWDGDFNLKDQNFFDLPHFELIEERQVN